MTEQIQAVKKYLASEGFVNVTDGPAGDSTLHPLRMTWKGESRLLRLSHTFLQHRRPEDVRQWLTDKMIGESLRSDPDARERLDILGDETINTPASLPLTPP
jgi:hypothetical protein